MEETIHQLRKGLESVKPADPCIMIIFGASGDLTKRKLIPSLYKLYYEKLLPEGFSVIGFSRSPMDHYNFRDAMKEAVKTFIDKEFHDENILNKFLDMIYYIQSEFTDNACYQKLQALIEKINDEKNCCGNRLFYLAVPPPVFPDIIKKLGENKLNKPCREDAWTRIIVEKPFGHDLVSARELNKIVTKFFKEEQIYRIDHYLGKETVQNLMVMRFGNGIFEPLWNRNYISHVQITAAESIGVENRASYYESAGALRDMVENHMIQLLTYIAMEPPVTFGADVIRTEKVQVLQSIPPMTPSEVLKNTVRAQYGKGIIDGKEVPAYRDEPGVDKNSTTETFTSWRLFIENWRWAGVPFFLRTGKRLPKRVTEISIVFKRTPHMIFQRSKNFSSSANILTIRIQPDEGISLQINAKNPGYGMNLKPVLLDFLYGESFGEHISDAYERLLLDCMAGDQTLYIRSDSVESAWTIITPIHDAWDQEKLSSIPIYRSGSWGPEESDELIGINKFKWRNP